MLKNQNIICISSIDWDFIWQGHQEIMFTFAKNGNRVLFIENTGVRSPTLKDLPRLKKRILNWRKSIGGFRQQADNLYIYSPILFPFPYSKIASWVNKYFLINSLKHWIKVMDFYEPIIWTFLPTRIALELIRSLPHRKLLVYYCIANFEGLIRQYRKVRKTERKLIQICDLIFAQGKSLEKKCKRLNENVFIFPFGVNTGAFQRFEADESNKIPDDIKNLNRPIIGYVGGLHKHIDFKLLKYLALKQPTWSIVLVGPIQTNIIDIKNLPNIFILGEKDFSMLPSYINEFDVCIIPYRLTKYTNTVYPTKLNEYHSLGKPVVSTPLPEVIAFNKSNNNLIMIADTEKEFVHKITQIVENKNNEDNEYLVNKRIESAKANSWDNRIERMSELIEETLQYKKKSIPLDWQRRFREFYWTSRRRILRLAVLFSLVWGLIFYTPIVWFIAEPLKISQPPQRADAIVIFAGGVGESGRPGQGYEERVAFGVQLYKDGYAPYIIFSSGSTYAFKETVVMKALATSLGVPEEQIILEDKAISTYQNVLFTKEILEKMDWRKILLVSSPYHMRRSSLVFRKWASQIQVIYTPISMSRFYMHGITPHGKRVWRQVNLRQMRGILHEYLGIIYYWWKGYI